MTLPRPRPAMKGLSSNWMEDANCLYMDPELFFPPKGVIPSEGYRVCLECPVKDECLDYSILTNARSGVWGGVGEREKLRMIAKYNRTTLLPNQAEKDRARKRVEYVVMTWGSGEHTDEEDEGDEDEDDEAEWGLA